MRLITSVGEVYEWGLISYTNMKRYVKDRGKRIIKNEIVLTKAYTNMIYIELNFMESKYYWVKVMCKIFQDPLTVCSIYMGIMYMYVQPYLVFMFREVVRLFGIIKENELRGRKQILNR